MRRSSPINRKNENSALYSIGAVAGLTGLSTSTIRTWERRHNAVEPTRTEKGGRRYTEADVERIQLLCRLTQAGESIGLVAPLETELLRARVDELRQAPSGAVTKMTRIAILHRSLGVALRESEEDRIEIVQSVDAMTALQPLSSKDTADVAFVEFPLLGGEPIEALQEIYDRTRARLVVVDYTFARREALEAIVEGGALAVRGPVTVADVSRIVSRVRDHSSRPFMAPSAHLDAPAPRFTRERLARLRELAPSNACECPNHIATLVSSLSEFEDYSKACISNNPKDRELHAGLAVGTSRARAVMEELLMQLCEHEGIEV
jgi:DNA-binding transcriptional MerR regulator